MQHPEILIATIHNHKEFCSGRYDTSQYINLSLWSSMLSFPGDTNTQIWLLNHLKLWTHQAKININDSLLKLCLFMIMHAGDCKKRVSQLVSKCLIMCVIWQEGYSLCDPWLQRPCNRPGVIDEINAFANIILLSHCQDYYIQYTITNTYSGLVIK